MYFSTRLELHATRAASANLLHPLAPYSNSCECSLPEKRVSIATPRRAHFIPFRAESLKFLKYDLAFALARKATSFVESRSSIHKG